MFGLTPYRRWVPTGRLTDFGSAFDDFFDRAWPLADTVNAGSFKMDLREEENQYIVEAELPGVSKGDISLDVDDNQLTISVNHEESGEEQKGNYIHRERRSYSARRSVYLPNIKPEDISARFADGILTITAPKADPDAHKSKIEIM